MANGRGALIVATDTYADPQLRQLRAPGRDAQALAEVLGDPDIGDFDVRVVMNGRSYEVRLALEDFFSERRPDELLLVHFSCHGVKDETGRLFFAATDTQKARLNATAIAAEYVNDLINRTRSRQVVLLLDCCFSGAFTRGMVARSSPTLDVAEGFHGRGRAVLTASGALEYAWEGDELTRLNEPSIFTSAIVAGLRSGEADRDRDQHVSVDDLYDYVFDEVRRKTPNQTPGKWSNVEGTLVIARSPRRPAQLPAALVEASEDERVSIRAAAVAQLAELLNGSDVELAGAARARLVRLVDDDSRRVSDAAQAALGTPSAPRPTEPAAHAARPHGPTASIATVPSDRTGVGLSDQTALLLAAIVGGGWAAGWILSLALCSSRLANDRLPSAIMMLVGWCIAAPLVASGLRLVAPALPLGRALLIGVGWPVCILVGLAVPVVMLLSAESAALLGLAVTAAGLLGALAVVPALDQPVRWERVVLVVVGFVAGWLWPGTTTWPDALWKLGNGYADGFPQLFSDGYFPGLVSAGLLSGLLGGLLLYFVLLRPARRSSA